MRAEGGNRGRQRAGKAFHPWNKSQGWLATNMMQHRDTFINLAYASEYCTYSPGSPFSFSSRLLTFISPCVLLRQQAAKTNYETNLNFICPPF